MRINRRYLLITVAVILLVVGLLAKAVLDATYRLPILMYHSIRRTSDKANKMIVSPEAFARQMKFLRDRRYNVVPLAEAVGYIREKKAPPPRTVAITIDDGYEDNYKEAYPILKRNGIPATIFVIVDMVGKENFMEWGEIKELSDSGLIDIESHTISHPWLTGLDDRKLSAELVESKKVLEEKLGKKIRFLCYPMGGYDERVKEAARIAGYEAAFATKTTRFRPNYDIYAIKRVRVSSTADNLFVFWIKTSGYHAFFRVLQGDYKEIPHLLWKRKS